jgi:phosphoglycolate phosphatase-like HAD superfamily hydrolase
MPNGFPTIDGTTIEIVAPPTRGKIRHALFDFDGTLSALRDGWQDYMVPLMVEVLEACPRREPREDLERMVVDFVDHLTGKQTIYQMIRLSEEVEKRGGKPLDPMEYKREYYRRMQGEIGRRLSDLRSGATPRDAFLVEGARGFLEDVARRRIRMYLASGTDVELVVAEAEALGIARYFDGGIFGALTNYKDFSKEKVIRGILDDFKLQGSELLVIGDGYVEIQNGRDVDAVTFGVYAPERNKYHMNANKRDRLLRAGAHLLAPDLKEGSALLDYLRAGAE